MINYYVFSGNITSVNEHTKANSTPKGSGTTASVPAGAMVDENEKHA